MQKEIELPQKDKDKIISGIFINTIINNYIGKNSLQLPKRFKINPGDNEYVSIDGRDFKDLSGNIQQ